MTARNRAGIVVALLALAIAVLGAGPASAAAPVTITSPADGGGGGNCTPGYSPCLAYHGGADYDCYGWSGNGPYYTQAGVVYRVTGSDPYDLHADSDGYGCE